MAAASTSLKGSIFKAPGSFRISAADSGMGSKYFITLVIDPVVTIKKQS